MEKPEPKLSIITATYNSRPYLDDLAKSILPLRVDFEWILSDDCSSDTTPDALRDLAASDARVRPLFNASNLGLWGNWKAASERARGDYLLFLDADDMLGDPTWLEEAVRVLDAEPGIGLAVARIAYMDAQGNDYKVRSLPFAHYGRRMSGRALAWRILLSPTYPLRQGVVVYRRSSLLEHRTFDINLVLEVAKSFDAQLVDAVGLRYRIVPGSLSNQTHYKDGYWPGLVAGYFSDQPSYGLRYPITAYKVGVGALKPFYRRLSPNRI